MVEPGTGASQYPHQMGKERPGKRAVYVGLFRYQRPFDESRLHWGDCFPEKGLPFQNRGFVFPSVFIVLALAKLFFKYGDIGPVRGILNGLRPAVVALICSAGLSFVMLALWNTETLPKDFTKVDLLGCIVLPISLWCIRHKVSVIRTLCMSGVLGLILGIAGIR